MSQAKCDHHGHCVGMQHILDMKGGIGEGFVGLSRDPAIVYTAGKGRAKANFIFNRCPSCGEDIRPKAEKKKDAAAAKARKKNRT